MINDDLEKKPARLTKRCLKMLDKAIKFYKEEAGVPKQAEILSSQFFKAIRLMEIMPGIGAKYKSDMRKFLLGKFPYYIYYKEKAKYISIRGIWHTSRGEEFKDVK
jgi:hypothetical protein